MISGTIASAPVMKIGTFNYDTAPTASITVCISPQYVLAPPEPPIATLHFKNGHNQSVLVTSVPTETFIAGCLTTWIVPTNVLLLDNAAYLTVEVIFDNYYWYWNLPYKNNAPPPRAFTNYNTNVYIKVTEVRDVRNALVNVMYAVSESQTSVSVQHNGKIFLIPDEYGFVINHTWKYPAREFVGFPLAAIAIVIPLVDFIFAVNPTPIVVFRGWPLIVGMIVVEALVLILPPILDAARYAQP